jgi:hypothetical protein
MNLNIKKSTKKISINSSLAYKMPKNNRHDIDSLNDYILSKKYLISV